MRDLKNINWISNLNQEIDESFHRRQGMISIYTNVDEFTVFVQNFKIKRNKIYYDPDKFYIATFIETRKLKEIKQTFKTLDEAKEFTKEEIVKFIFDKYFKPAEIRKVITEKSNSKNPIRANKKINKKKTPAPAEVIDLNEEKPEKKRWHKFETNDWNIIIKHKLIGNIKNVCF